MDKKDKAVSRETGSAGSFVRELKLIALYAGSLVILVWAVAFGADRIVVSDRLASAKPVSADLNPKSVVREAQPDHQPHLIKAFAAEPSRRPPTIQRGFSSFYDEHDLRPLPKLAAGRKYVPRSIIQAEYAPAKRKRYLRREVPPGMYIPPRPIASAFCFLC